MFVGSKLHFNDECPVDICFISIAEFLCPYFKKMNMTPNIITTFSLITGIFSGYFLYKNNIVLSAILFAISYLLDCTDGHFARKYQMQTKFGDYYDHFADIFKVILILSILYTKINKKYRVVYFSTVFVLFCFLLSHMGCQEILTDNTDSESLHFCKNMCKLEYHKILRFFGCGTFMLFIILSILLSNYWK